MISCRRSISSQQHLAGRFPCAHLPPKADARWLRPERLWSVTLSVQRATVAFATHLQRSRGTAAAGTGGRDARCKQTAALHLLCAA